MRIASLLSFSWCITVACSGAPNPAPATPAAGSAGSASAKSYVPPSGPPGPKAEPGFPSYAAYADAKVDALKDAAPDARDAFCKEHCVAAHGWSSNDFTKSSITDFFQTPEETDVRCDFSETGADIGGSEQHSGDWIERTCHEREARACYWSINYAAAHQGRVACVRAVFAK